MASYAVKKRTDGKKKHYYWNDYRFEGGKIVTVIISGIKTYEKLESKKLLYNYEYNRIKNLEMAIS